MSYATPDDVIARYPNRDLVQITNEDPSATNVNTAFIQRALDDASVEIDTYIEARFTLPLTDPPAVLNRLCSDIAMYRMQSLRPIHDLEDARKRYDDAIAMLQRVAKGELTLGLSADSLEPTIAQNVEVVVGPHKKFTRHRLKGF